MMNITNSVALSVERREVNEYKVFGVQILWGYSKSHLILKMITIDIRGFSQLHQILVEPRSFSSLGKVSVCKYFCVNWTFFSPRKLIELIEARNIHCLFFAGVHYFCSSHLFPMMETVDFVQFLWAKNHLLSCLWLETRSRLLPRSNLKVSSLRIPQRHRMEAADNWANAGTTTSSAGEGL